MTDSIISIIDFEPIYEADFKRLNLEWLDKYGLTEEPDLEMINHPQIIIDNGGFIYFAKSGKNIVGSAALIKVSDYRYELAKMAVESSFQGRGISKMLIETCIATATKSGAKTVYLSSNSQLKTAISLYKKYGFKHIPVTDSQYTTADVMMELKLEE